VIILDTNVLSALMRPRPEPAVLNWLDRQPTESVWITVITFFEIRSGLALLPEGKRREFLQDRFSQLLREALEGRVLVFDRLAADEAAILEANRQRSGRPVEMRDTFIAGIALARKAALATGNTRHFEDSGVPLIDPWDVG
jgi:hypothetical protein